MTAALALPLAFGAAGVAAAHDGGSKEAHGASYEAECASAGPKGASTCEVESESGGMSMGDDHKYGHKRHDKGHDKHHDKGGHGKHHDKGYEKGWASYEKEGAKANYKGAFTWEVESSAGYVDKN